ncbi:hypothetical protein Vadar_024528 [Vaccinium darrowii]|uniref:Uncharacterized protein n=1 Tax=Vaccinium darrowii TaxID=229202 RepID=A0ACB7Z7G6_9ERIC|nr:hypothetical protein Vadar_024528 [Vaccinium darrowii]
MTASNKGFGGYYKKKRLFYPPRIPRPIAKTSNQGFQPNNIKYISLSYQQLQVAQVLSRISVLGSAFLAILAAGPALIEQTTHLIAFRGFAGTSVLILVGCATDTARKVQAEIISQKYKNIEFYEIDRL